jgi:hypothetical protein
MNTYNVPQAEWSSFFDQFSRIHHGQPVEVETIEPQSNTVPTAPRLKSRTNTRGAPLLGITAESEQSNRAPRLHISAGDETGVQLSHSIAAPRRVRASEWNDGISAAVEIESEDGTTTCVRVGPEHEMLEPGFILDGIQT